MGVENEGSIVFWCRCTTKDWTTDDQGYQFPTVYGANISATAVKHPDKTIQLTISGPFHQTFVFRQAIPKCHERGLFVALTWKDSAVNLYLNAVLTATASA